VDSNSASAILASGNATVATNGGVFVRGGVRTSGNATSTKRHAGLDRRSTRQSSHADAAELHRHAGLRIVQRRRERDDQSGALQSRSSSPLYDAETGVPCNSAASAWERLGEWIGGSSPACPFGRRWHWPLVRTPPRTKTPPLSQPWHCRWPGSRLRRVGVHDESAADLDSSALSDIVRAPLA